MKLSITLVFIWIAAVPSFVYSKSEIMSDIVDLGEYQLEMNIPAPPGYGDEFRSVKFEFYPIGFSEKGLFAYFYFESGDPADCDVYEFTVLDLAIDKRIYDLNSKMHEAPRCQELKTVEDFVRKHENLIKNIIRKYQIKKIQLSRIDRFPFAGKNELIFAYLAKKDIPDISHEIPYEVRLKSNRRGTKIVGVQMEYDQYIFGSNVLGYLKSPYGPIIVILVQSFKSHHGPPYMAKLSFFGATLNSGFEK